MKVAYLIGSLNRGGAETLLLDIFRKCESTHFDMILIHRKGGLYENDFENEKPHCYRVAPRKWHFCAYLRQLRKTFIDEHVTIIHAFYWLEVIFAKLATIGLNIPIVITFHGYLGGEAGWFEGLRYRLAMQQAKKLCFVSNIQMQSYEKRYGAIVRKKGVVLYNGLNFEKFELPNGRSSELTKGRNIKLCMVGNFNSVRSQMVICKALQKLRVKSQALRVGFEFSFIGGRCKGEEHYYDECVAYCKEQDLNNVHFLGVREDIPVLLKSMDGFVYSSSNDTFGIAVIEAISSGLPIIVNDHPVMKEVCGETNEGIRYFQTGAAEDAAEKIAELLVDLAKSKSIAKENAVKVRDKYSIQRHIQKVNTIYQSL